MTCAGRAVNFSISVFHWYLTEAGATTSTRSNSPAAAEQFGSSESLHGFPQPHIVGEDDAATAGGKNGALLLVGQELGLQDTGQRILATAELRAEAAVPDQGLRRARFPGRGIRARRCR